MIIAMYKRTKIAMAPDELCKAINKYSEHTCFMVNGINEALSADIIHFHNRHVPVNHPRQIIQYHSEPERVDLSVPHKKLVIAQYHATLPEYRGCAVVRNVVDFNNKIYNTVNVKKLKIGYSPSQTVKLGKWFDKGFAQTKAILEKLKREMGIDYDIITGVDLKEAIQRKSKCSVLIDECVTPSYHRCTLEGLALGKMTICSVSPAIQKVVMGFTGNHALPVENVSIDRLYSFLADLKSRSFSEIQEKGRNNRCWMETYWSPEQIVDEFLNNYRRL